VSVEENRVNFEPKRVKRKGLILRVWGRQNLPVFRFERKKKIQNGPEGEDKTVTQRGKEKRRLRRRKESGRASGPSPYHASSTVSSIHSREASNDL